MPYLGLHSMCIRQLRAQSANHFHSLLQNIKSIPAQLSRGPNTRNVQERIDTQRLHHATQFWKRYTELKHIHPSVTLKSLSSEDFDSTPHFRYYSLV